MTGPSDSSNLFLIIVACFAGVAALSLASHWGKEKFQPQAPEVTATYNEVFCQGRAKILTEVTNSSSEPLSWYRIKIDIYLPNRSSVISWFDFGTDHIIQPGKTDRFCLDIPLSDVGIWLSAINGGMTPFEVGQRYGDTMAYAGREFLVDAIFRPTVLKYEHGLPY